MTILNPTDVIEPAHAGQLFFDASSHVFYQARERSAASWAFVPPADLPGSFVKIYKFFLGPAFDKKVNATTLEQLEDANAIKATMSLSGIEVPQALCWTTAIGARVMMVRLKFLRAKDVTLFVGFAINALAHVMPQGAGFDVQDGVVSFGGSTEYCATRDDVVTMRVEVAAGRATGYVNDMHVGSFETEAVTETPVVALFDRAPGPRPIASGYERALQRNLSK